MNDRVHLILHQMAAKTNSTGLLVHASSGLRVGREGFMGMARRRKGERVNKEGKDRAEGEKWNGRDSCRCDEE